MSRVGRNGESRARWEADTTQALDLLFRQIGAAVWPEVEAIAGETSWYPNNFPVPRTFRLQPHHLTTARRRLGPEGAGAIQEMAVELNRLRVSAWVDARALATRGRATEVRELAATKRRLYRSFLAWTSGVRLCGRVAEAVVDASLRELAGRYLWVSPSAERPGVVRELLGRAITVGGPLDAAGHWALDADDPAKGFVSFAVEIENLRATIYPWDHEAWDLLAKVADFPDVVPVLVARRIHPLAFNCFRDIGALGRATGAQWFDANRIAEDQFERVTKRLSFRDAVRVDPSHPDPAVVRWFRDLDRDVIRRQAERWERAAPILTRHATLRLEVDYGERHRLWSSFCTEIKQAGLYEVGGWAPEESIQQPNAKYRRGAAGPVAVTGTNACSCHRAASSSEHEPPPHARRRRSARRPALSFRAPAPFALHFWGLGP